MSKPEIKGFLWFSPQFLMQKGWIYEFLRKLRRAWLSAIHDEYVQKSIEAELGGACNRCGACCELLFKCPFLGRDSKSTPYCRIYGDLRPGSCKNYPFDAVDSEVDICGFKFDDPVKKSQK